MISGAAAKVSKCRKRRAYYHCTRLGQPRLVMTDKRAVCRYERQPASPAAMRRPESGFLGFIEDW